MVLGIVSLVERLAETPTVWLAVAIFVQDPIVMPPLAGEAFAELYGLTGSELRVLLAMAPGLCVKEAAETLRISESTAKDPPTTHSLQNRNIEADRTHPFVHECHTANMLWALGKLPTMSRSNSWALSAVKLLGQRLSG